MTQAQDPSQEELPDHKVLKAIVIGMGVLLILGFAALIFAVVYRASKSEQRTQNDVVEIIEAGDDMVAGALQKVSLPSDARDIEASYQDRRVVIQFHTASAPNERQMWIIHPGTGVIEMRLIIAAAKPTD